MTPAEWFFLAVYLGVALAVWFVAYVVLRTDGTGNGRLKSAMGALAFAVAWPLVFVLAI